MKEIFLFLMLLAAANLHAQDVIVKKDGSTILSKVMEVTHKEIKYKKFSNQNGPTYTIDISDILSVNYENGEKEEYGKIQKPTVDEPKSVMLKVGTGIPLRIVSPVKAADVEVGQTVGFKVSQDIEVNGVKVIPYGTPVQGTVYEAKKSSWWGTKGRLGIRIKGILLPGKGWIPLKNGTIYVTGTNRTALSVILFCIGLYPACAICGSKAHLPVGYEVMTNVEENMFFDMEGNLMDTPLAGVSSIPATLSIEGRTFEAAIVSTEGDVVTYIDKTSKSDGKVQEVPKSKVRNIRYH